MAVKKTVKRKNKNSRISKLTRALNFSTTKGKFLIFILTFAVVGGGYMAYQTFAATSASLVYTQITTSGTTHNTLISSIDPDATGNTLINASGWSESPASGTIASHGRYSPNHAFVAWATAPNPNPSQTGTIQVRNLSSVGSKSDATKSYAMPAGESPSNTSVPLAWYPDSVKLLLNTWKAADNTYSLYALDTSTGQFTKLLQLPVREGIGATIIQSMAVLGNNKSIIYSDDLGIQFVSVGATTPKQLKSGPNGACGKVRARPGTQTEFVYKCAEETAKKTSIYKQTTLTAPVEIQAYAWNTSQKNGAKSLSVNDFALSPDGTKLGLHVMEWTYTNVKNCEFSVLSRIYTTDYTATSSTKVLQNITQISNAVTQQGCKGGGDNPDINRIAWSPDNKSIGYIWWEGFSTYVSTNQGLATVTLPQYSSTGQAVVTQLNKTDVTDISW